MHTAIDGSAPNHRERWGDEAMGMTIRVLIMEGILAAILFASAGRADLPWFWAVLGLHAALVLGGIPFMDPTLRQERLTRILHPLSAC
jgi:hypothetical protein